MFKSDSSEASEDLRFKTDNRPFVGILDMKRQTHLCKELLERLTDKKEQLKTKFWQMFNANKEVKEEVKEEQRLSDVDRANEFFNEVDEAFEKIGSLPIKHVAVTARGFFKPRTNDAKKFLENSDYIIDQLFVKGENSGSVSHTLKIPHS